MKIVTDYWAKPIPQRQFDWVAHYDDEEGPHAYGATEQEAIDNLLSDHPPQDEATNMTADKDESAWLIEFPGHGKPTYYGLSGEGSMLGITSDHNDAIRFARKQDAEMMIADVGWNAAEAVEHMWCDGKMDTNRNQ